MRDTNFARARPEAGLGAVDASGSSWPPRLVSLGVAAVRVPEAATGCSGRPVDGVRAASSWLAMLALLAPLIVGGCSDGDASLRVGVTSTVEDRTPAGELFNPSTQSFERGHHWLEEVGSVAFQMDAPAAARVDLHSASDSHRLTLNNVPLDLLVPRLHYHPASPPDAFDAFNLMMAEYSRNGLAMPVGRPGDGMAHFETDLEATSPWTLRGDYEFDPNPYVRPLRVALVNNCLRPQLWELTAADTAGEMYHGWLELPSDPYLELVAKTNSLDRAFVASALEWREDPVPLALERLRSVRSTLAKETPVRRQEGEITYSSQDSRRKLGAHFVQVEREGQLQPPRDLAELVDRPVQMSQFVEPGKYSIDQRLSFDLGFLARPQGVEIRLVEPLTSYSMTKGATPDFAAEPHLEWIIDLGEYKLILGNLPLPLLVQQEDFVIHGFGVGILDSSALAERRRFLIDQGPHPSFAYLAVDRAGELWAVNSHAMGLEQIFIRSHPFEEEGYWELTLTSYERIVDLVRYRVPIPEQVLGPIQLASQRYIAPVYLSYRDDNVR